MNEVTLAGLRPLHAYCLHRPDGYRFCYGEATHVLQRQRNSFSTPVCQEHMDPAQAAIVGPLELMTLEEWLARPARGQVGWAGS